MRFLRNALRAPARSLMTMLGVSIGIALFVSLNTITADLRQQIAVAASQYDVEVMVYERRAATPFASRISRPQMEALQAFSGNAVQPMVLGTLSEHWNNYVLLIGVTPEFLKRVPLIAGSAFADGSDDAILGELLAHKLKLQPGQNLVMDGRPVRIAGLFRSGSRMFDGGVVTSIPVAQRMLTREGGEPQFTLGLLSAVSPGDVPKTIQALNAQFPSLKAMAGSEFEGSIRLFRVVDVFLKTISLVALLATCIVTSNTLLLAISERTREIGILLAVGWSPWLIVRMLFAESILLCCLGAGLGNLLALAMLQLFNELQSVGFGWIPVRFPLSLTAQSLFIALGMSALSMLWPTAVVLRMRPLRALRHE